jgi:DNA-binding GntR family transcriptional regulator
MNVKGLREIIAEKLRLAIFEGMFKPGDVLNVSIRAQQLNVSSSPIRDALLHLEKESLVRNVHNKGWFVIKLTPHEVKQIVGLRSVLEVVALKRAKQRLNSSNLKQLTNIHKELLRLIEQANWVEMMKKDYEFHRQIWALAQHQLLQETLVRISTPYFAYMQAVIRSLAVSPEEIKKSGAMHQSLIDYLANQRRLTAEKAIALHMEPANIENWDELLRIGEA